MEGGRTKLCSTSSGIGAEDCGNGTWRSSSCGGGGAGMDWCRWPLVAAIMMTPNKMGNPKPKPIIDQLISLYWFEVLLLLEETEEGGVDVVVVVKLPPLPPAGGLVAGDGRMD